MSCLAGPVIGRLWSVTPLACQLISPSEFPTAPFIRFHILMGKVPRILSNTGHIFGHLIVTCLRSGLQHLMLKSQLGRITAFNSVRCLLASYFPPFDMVHWLKGIFSSISMLLRHPLNIIIPSYLYVRAVGGTGGSAQPQTLLAVSKKMALVSLNGQSSASRSA